MNSQPLVTIGVLSYNNASYLAQTLDSAIQENYKNRELIIVDDCSKDDSVKVINDWIAKHPEEKVTVIVHQHNKGVCKALNEILEVATGKYIAAIGSDDIYFPNKLAIQVPLLENAPEEVGVVYSKVQMIGPDGELLPTPAEWVDIHNGEIFLPLLTRDFIPAMSTLVRRSCFDSIGSYDENLSYEDWDMWLRIAKKYEFKFSDELSAYYRVHPASAMHTRKVVLMESTLELLQKHWGESPEADEIIRRHVHALSEQLFQYGSAKAKQWLKVRWLQNKDIRSFAFMVLAELGISGARVQQAQRLLHRQ